MQDILFEAFCATFDQFEAGFVAVKPDGEILYANQAAREMMSEGWPIHSDGGYLLAGSEEATAALLESLQRTAELAIASPSREVCLDVCLADATCPKGAAIAIMKPLVNGKREASAVALFVSTIKTPDGCALSGIAECFGLTPAETKTLHHVVEGGTVAGARDALDISENTVKTHLQNIFAKTRASRQAQLIKLVNDLRPPLTLALENGVASCDMQKVPALRTRQKQKRQ